LQTLSKATTIKDYNGKEHNAFAIFVMTINYLKSQLLEEITKQIADFEERDIIYVLTVPAIWNENAKRFMREAAEQVTMLAFSLYQILQRLVIIEAFKFKIRTTVVY